MIEYYKYDEIKQHFLDFIEDQGKEWVEQNRDDLHHHAFNTNYIIYTYQAQQWLGEHVFECIEIIKDYEQSNFGQVTTDLSSPEEVVNMYAYIVGEQVVNDVMD